MKTGYQSAKRGFPQDIPEDRLLPNLFILLNPATVVSLLSDHMKGALGGVERCDIMYIRYKPATNCIVAYSLQYKKNASEESSQILFYIKLYTESDYQNAVKKSQLHRWVSSPGLKPLIALPEYNAILYFFPNDCIIDGLRLLSNPKKLQRMLYEHYEKYPEREWRISDRKLRLTTVRYKPERRVVLRCDTRATHRGDNERKSISVYLRLYADDRGAEVYRLQQKLYREARVRGVFSVPRPITYLPERRLFLMEALPGKPSLFSLTDGGSITAVALSAKALAALHRVGNFGLAEISFKQCLENAGSTAEMLNNILSGAAGMAEEIVDILKGYEYPDNQPAGFVHGDFYHGQVLLQGDGVSIIDFDRSHAGDFLEDIGNYIAHLRYLRAQGRITDDVPLEREFIKTYEETTGEKLARARLNFWIAFSLFQLAVGPFRRLEANWRKMTEIILKECREILVS